MGKPSVLTGRGGVSSRLALAGLILLVLLGCGCASRQASGPAPRGCPASPGAAILREPGMWEALRKIQAGISGAAGASAELQLVAGAEPNAYVWRKGQKQFMAITDSLIELVGGDKDELAFVMAHEMAHLSLGHLDARERYRKTIATTGGVVGTALEIVGIGLGIPFSGFISSLTTNTGEHLIGLRFDRDQEREADRLGLAIMTKAGYEPRAAIRFQERILALPNRRSIPIFSTHPQGEERVALLRALLEEAEGGAPPAGGGEDD